MARKQTLVPLKQEETGTGHQVYWKMSVLKKRLCKARTQQDIRNRHGSVALQLKLQRKYIKSQSHLTKLRRSYKKECQQLSRIRKAGLRGSYCIWKVKAVFNLYLIGKKNKLQIWGSSWDKTRPFSGSFITIMIISKSPAVIFSLHYRCQEQHNCISFGSDSNCSFL